MQHDRAIRELLQNLRRELAVAATEVEDAKVAASIARQERCRAAQLRPALIVPGDVGRDPLVDVGLRQPIVLAT